MVNTFKNISVIFLLLQAMGVCGVRECFWTNPEFECSVFGENKIFINAQFLLVIFSASEAEKWVDSVLLDFEKFLVWFRTEHFVAYFFLTILLFRSRYFAIRTQKLITEWVYRLFEIDLKNSSQLK